MSDPRRMELPSTTAVVRRFKSNVRALNDTLVEARNRWPKAQYYLSGSTLNLMRGDHHEGKGATARQDRVISSARLLHGDGGDW